MIASAGSGKTSTLIAKAGYVIQKGYFKPSEILLLAFNRDAANELRDRLKARLNPLGIDTEDVASKTFHAFGLEVIGEATGKRPSVASWLDSGQDLATLQELVDELKDRNETFRTNWDLFRVVFGQDLPEFGKEQDSPDSWDKEKATEGFWTLNGEVVKSRGEQLLANWLFYNGVEYLYEAPYSLDTASSQYRQYHPDFYFPQIDTYLEHWALDKNGEPPPDFSGYKESMLWKKKLHRDNGTKLLETTMAELWSGSAFKYLSDELTAAGIELDPNPDRPSTGRRPIENPRLVKIFRSFLIHKKNNQLSLKQLKDRIENGAAGRFRYRHSMFLSLFENLFNAWEAKLRAEKSIDFEDMLLQAFNHIDSGRWRSPYKLIMVDEFQDASKLRAQLVKGLLRDTDRYLFAVGDDWQSINRFAGSDLSVMTDFGSVYGNSVRLKLETTFRCPQTLCDISSEFIQKNPQQLSKTVKSFKDDVNQPLRIVRVDDESEIKSAMELQLRRIADSIDDHANPARILVLGRYKSDLQFVPSFSNKRLRVDFMTAHSSKGLEAEHVIIPHVTSEIMGFPSRIEDDPVMQLAMPATEKFEYAEERRLFYVALTRAKESVTLITVYKRESSFITELIKQNNIQVLDINGVDQTSQLCPSCGQGFMTAKKGKYGDFLGCSKYPQCRYSESINKIH